MIKSYCLVEICIVSFWYKNKILGVLRVAVKSLDAFYDIAHIDIKFFASKRGFTSGKCWPF